MACKCSSSDQISNDKHNANGIDLYILKLMIKVLYGLKNHCSFSV